MKIDEKLKQKGHVLLQEFIDEVYKTADEEGVTKRLVHEVAETLSNKHNVPQNKDAFAETMIAILEKERGLPIPD